MASYLLRKESDHESYLSNLLWYRCSKNLFLLPQLWKPLAAPIPLTKRNAFPPLTIHMNYITVKINDVDKMIKSMISSNTDFETAVQFLCTIPVVKPDSECIIISEIGTDMSQFSSSKHLCCWADLAPGSNEPGSKKNLFGLHVPESTSNLH